MALMTSSGVLSAVFIAFSFSYFVQAASVGCSLQLKALSERPPLLLRPGGALNVSGFVTPDVDHVLHLGLGTPVLLSCPGAYNELLYNNVSSGVRQVNATCVGRWQMRARGVLVDARAASCKVHAEHVAERDGRLCGAAGRGRRVRVGFRLLTGFLETVGACFDEQALSPIYSNYTLVRAIAGKRPGGERAIFRSQGLFGDVSPRRAYDQQNATLRALLGQPFASNDSLTRGHLAARGGFVFWPQKRSTFFYVNAAPQWKQMNAGAWAAVERSARSLAAARGDLLVVTGVYGIATLVDVLGRPTPLYLYVNGTQRKMPVPALFWKVIYDPRTHEAAAVVGYNTPEQEPSLRPDLHLCPDVCPQLRWLEVPKALASSIYCCEVNALRERVDDLPLSDVRGLLTNSTPRRKQNEQTTVTGKGMELTGWEALMAGEKAGINAQKEVSRGRNNVEITTAAALWNASYDERVTYTKITQEEPVVPTKRADLQSNINEELSEGKTMLATTNTSEEEKKLTGWEALLAGERAMEERHKDIKRHVEGNEIENKTTQNIARRKHFTVISFRKN